MKTVIFIERDVADAREDLMPSYQKHERLYTEIAKAFGIEICPWYSQGQTIEEAVPDLYNLLHGASSWRGIVACDLSFGRGKNAGQNIVANPFDVYDLPEQNSGNFELNKECLEDPLAPIRLSRMLGGIPKSYRSRSYIQGDAEFESEEARAGKMMRYHLHCPLANELVFISPRNTNPSVLMFDKEGSRTSELVNCLDFTYVERAGYADCSRFVVLDRALPPSTLYDKNMLAYWLFLFSYALVGDARSTLDLGQLYKAGLELDEDLFTQAEAKRFAQFSLVLDAIEEHVSQARNDRKNPTVHTMQELPNFKTRITDYFQLNKSDAYEDDIPRPGRVKEPAEVNTSARAVRESKRYVRRAIAEYRDCKAPKFDEVASCLLNASTKEALYDDICDAELRLARLSESSQLKNALSSKGKPKDLVGHPRLDKKKAIITAAIACAFMVATLLMLIPSPIGIVVPSVTVGVIACLGMAGLTALLYLYYRKKAERIDRANLLKIAAEMQASPLEAYVAQASERMSDYVSVRNGWLYYEHDIPDNAFIGDEERFLAQKYAELSEVIEPLYSNQELQERMEEEKQALAFLDWPHVLKGLQAGKYDGLQMHSYDAYARFNTDMDGLSQFRVPLKAIKRVDMQAISPYIFRELG